MTKRITIHFKHPELWNDFTEKITNQYGTTRVHRTEQLEKLLKGYINNDDLQHELEETKQTGSYQVMLMCQKENILLKQQLKSQPKEIVEKIKNICCIEDKCEDGSFVLGINEKDLDTILKEYDS